MADVHVRDVGSMDDYESIDKFNQQYLLMREEQEEWIENRYDLTTLAGINSIPLFPENAPGSSPESSTGTVDMYLRTRGFGYEKDGEPELALACLRKSNEIRFAKKCGYRKEDYYAYVMMLVRCGYVDDARKEKKRIDRYFGDYIDDSHTITWGQSLRLLKWNQRKERKAELKQMFDNWDNLIETELDRANKKQEYQFVLEHLPAICPKSQSAYTRAKNDNTKRYQLIVQTMKEEGLVFPEKLS